MQHVNHGRRRLLQASALIVGAAAPLSFTQTAEALTVTPLDEASPAGLAYSNRCGVNPEHAALKRRLKSVLARDSSAASMSENCPLCGCPVIVAR